MCTLVCFIRRYVCNNDDKPIKYNLNTGTILLSKSVKRNEQCFLATPSDRTFNIKIPLNFFKNFFTFLGFFLKKHLVTNFPRIVFMVKKIFFFALKL